ncbi:MAG: acetylxylan esterase [Bacteroidales bacterium]|jgi:cephalosporin-C deacetylase-like acetyl esterase|nr:acetylxylan esterase [Bacteroidales bacterium]
MRKTLFLLFVLGCLLFVPCSASAQYRNTGNYVTIRLTPDRADWTYRCKSDVRLELQVIRHNVAIPNVTIGYTWGYEQRPALTKDSLRIDKTGKTTLTLHGADVPGFMTFTANVRIDGEQYTNYINLAFDPLRIQPTTTLPEDFMSWWQAELKKAEQVPLMPVFKHEPGMSNGKADVYMVHFQNHKAGSYIYGMLTVPKTPGKHAAVVEYPGAGIHKFQSGNMAWADSDIVCLQIGIHGIPLDMEAEVYQNLTNGGMANYAYLGLEHRDNYYYRRVFLGAAKAVDFLKSLDYVDSTRIGVYGGSQGGLLSLVVAALKPEVRCVSAAYPAMCETAGSRYERAEGWPRLFVWRKGTDTPQIRDVVRYFDAVNFARFVTQDIQFIQGYNDHVCMPTTTFSAYNVIPKGRKILLTPYDCSHWLYPEQHAARRQWMCRMLR